MVEGTRVTDEVIEERKKEAESKSSDNGHKLGEWTERNGAVRSRCINEKCIGRAAISLSLSGATIGAAVWPSKFYVCPITMG